MPMQLYHPDYTIHFDDLIILFCKIFVCLFCGWFVSSVQIWFESGCCLAILVDL